MKKIVQIGYTSKNDIPSGSVKISIQVFCVVQKTNVNMKICDDEPVLFHSLNSILIKNGIKLFSGVQNTNLDGKIVAIGLVLR